MTPVDQRRGLVVDSHVHLWDPRARRYPWVDDLPRLNRRFDLADFGIANERRSRAVVLVQADCAWGDARSETEWFIAASTPETEVVAVVAAAPLERPDVIEHLEWLGSLPTVAGVRRLIQDEPTGFAVDPTFVTNTRALARWGLTADLCLRSHQLAEVTALVTQVPEVTFILDHCGKPAIDADEFNRWAADIKELALRPNVYCKLSGLATETTRHPDRIGAHLSEVLSTFGATRSMFGSDWPVCTGATTWPGWLATVEAVVDNASPTEQDSIFSRTACSAYRFALPEDGD